MISTRQGFTLIELIAAMVLVGVAAAVAGVGFMSFLNIGQGKKSVEVAQLAQQRLELILAEKRKNGFPTSESELDPCSLLDDDDVCKDNVNVLFTPDSGDECVKENSEFVYCDVKVTVTMGSEEYDFYIQLYHYD
jgi:prepilin-type N-terminal cleavage/methylation domain-containing protein